VARIELGKVALCHFLDQNCGLPYWDLQFISSLLDFAGLWQSPFVGPGSWVSCPLAISSFRVEVDMLTIPNSRVLNWPICPLCDEIVKLETSITDEAGQAVHEACYILKVKLHRAICLKMETLRQTWMSV